MESEKVKEIKKALKYCCGECDCDCPFYKNGKSYEECKSLLLFEALTLINGLEKENDKLKGNIAYQEKCKEQLVNACDECNSKIEKFAEMLKEKLEESNFINNGLWLVDTQVLIDETLKEFINE